MSIKDLLEKDLLEAVRNRDELRKKTIRIAITSIKLAEVEQGGKLEDSIIFSILQKEIKMRHETIEEAKKENRESIIKEAETEITILQGYLPKPLSKEELIELAKETIKELNATNVKEMGSVMKALIPKIQGRASNELISQVVREILQNQ